MNWGVGKTIRTGRTHKSRASHDRKQNDYSQATGTLEHVKVTRNSLGEGFSRYHIDQLRHILREPARNLDPARKSTARFRYAPLDRPCLLRI